MTSQSVYSLILNLIGLDWHTGWYIQYFRWPVVEWLKTKKETNEEHDEDSVEEGNEFN